MKNDLEVFQTVRNTFLNRVLYEYRVVYTKIQCKKNAFLFLVLYNIHHIYFSFGISGDNEHAKKDDETKVTKINNLF